MVCIDRSSKINAQKLIKLLSKSEVNIVIDKEEVNNTIRRLTNANKNKYKVIIEYLKSIERQSGKPISLAWRLEKNRLKSRPVEIVGDDTIYLNAMMYASINGDDKKISISMKDVYEAMALEYMKFDMDLDINNTILSKYSVIEDIEYDNIKGIIPDGIDLIASAQSCRAIDTEYKVSGCMVDYFHNSVGGSGYKTAIESSMLIINAIYLCDILSNLDKYGVKYGVIAVTPFNLYITIDSDINIDYIINDIRFNIFGRNVILTPSVNIEEHE